MAPDQQPLLGACRASRPVQEAMCEMESAFGSPALLLDQDSGA